MIEARTSTFETPSRWRRVLALLAAPAAPGPLLYLMFGRATESYPGDPVVVFLEAWGASVLMFAALAAPAAGLLLLVRRLLRLPGRSLDTILLFSVLCAILMIAFTLLARPPLFGLMGMAAFGAFLGLIMALAYCLIAGVPWRARAAD